MYQYFLGITLVGGGLWALMFWKRPDLRRAMLWAGWVYIAFLTVGFLIYRLVMHNVATSITPGYWAPPTLFNLGAITKGYAIEDALFMLFMGGVAAAVYEVCFCLRPSTVKKVGKPKWWLPLIIGIVAAYVFRYFFQINDIYILIMLHMVMGVVIAWQRRDLVANVLWSGALMTLVYAALFLLFNAMFPDFIDKYYNLQLTSGRMLLGIPLEEYLYALTFGMGWGPFYKYAKGLAASEPKAAPGAAKTKRVV